MSNCPISLNFEQRYSFNKRIPNMWGVNEAKMVNLGKLRVNMTKRGYIRLNVGKCT